MTSELKQQWIEALRSGRYKQGIRALRDINEAYCPLGVLCDILDMTQWEHSIWECGNGQKCHIFSWRGSSVRLSYKARHDIGLPDSAQLTIMSLNDRLGWTFAQIADWIEKNVIATG